MPENMATSKTPRPTRVLVVYDFVPSALTLGWALEACGHEVVICYSGSEAVAASKSFQPDVILLNIGMPNMKGLEACRTIRENSNMDGCFIIAQTAWSDFESREQTAEAGFDLHLVKPLDFDEINGLIISAGLSRSR